MKNDVIKCIIDKKGRLISEEPAKLINIVGGTDIEKKKKGKKK